MDKQKVVVILLLITIILSTISMILTFAIDAQPQRIEREVITNQGPSSGQVSFAITPESERGAAG